MVLKVTDNDDHDIDALSTRDKCRVDNAFSVMLRRCQDHAITESLDDCAMGDAKELFSLIHNHFFRPTPSGKQMAMKNLYSMSMATTAPISLSTSQWRPDTHVLSLTMGTLFPTVRSLTLSSSDFFLNLNL